MKKNGFTLAEVLITLAIIGVVAAMTIPTLIANYQQKSWDTAASVFNRRLGEALKVMNVNSNLAGFNSKDKLTHAGIYGINMSIDTIEDFIGIDIYYYIRVNFNTLVNVIDTSEKSPCFQNRLRDLVICAPGPSILSPTARPENPIRTKSS